MVITSRLVVMVSPLVMMVPSTGKCKVHIFTSMYSSRKISIPTPWKVSGNSYEEGLLPAKILEWEAKYEAELESPGGEGGAKQTNLLVGEYYGYFLELHQNVIPDWMFKVLPISL